MQAAWYSRPRIVEILKNGGKSFHSKNVFSLLILITHFIILTDELKIQISHLCRNNDSIGSLFSE